jgi:hypothetical protein
VMDATKAALAREMYESKKRTVKFYHRKTA